MIDGDEHRRLTVVGEGRRQIGPQIASSVSGMIVPSCERGPGVDPTRREGVLRFGQDGHRRTPNRVTTDGHDSCPRAIRTTLGAGVLHGDSQYLNNRLEQDHRGVKGRNGPMSGFKCPRSAGEFCRA